ncbi:MAG: glycosyltransferase family 1 protein [Haliangiales bacterium]
MLHIFGRMDRGGAETWVMNVLRQLARQRADSGPTIVCDFLVHDPRRGAFDDEIRALGGCIHVARERRDPVRYGAALRRVIQLGGYRVVHSHVGHFSGVVMTVAHALGVPGRIAHSHNDFSRAQPSPTRRLYERAMRALIRVSATHTLGCSQIACESLFGADWHASGRSRVLLYGYDFSPFAGIDERHRARARRALGLADDDLVIGHIGHFSDQKNHDFIVALADHLRQRPSPRQRRFVLIGDGPLRPDIERAIAARGLSAQFVLAGVRGDVPALLPGFDVMLLPSRWEGLGIVVLEAQAAGVPCLLSDRVPAEASVIPALVTQRAIAEPSAGPAHAAALTAWADAIADIIATDHTRPTPAQALAAMQACPFSITRNVERLSQIYAHAADGAPDTDSTPDAPAQRS